MERSKNEKKNNQDPLAYGGPAIDVATDSLSARSGAQQKKSSQKNSSPLRTLINTYTDKGRSSRGRG